MQHNITVLCDRCHKKVHGIHDPEAGITGGFYRVGGAAQKNSWAKYRNSGEAVLCDKCMHSDIRYKADMGIKV
jgi:hypothetical protein